MTDASFDELLLQATCSISASGKLRGTGWLVDQAGHIVTAGHVLGAKAPLDKVDVAFLNEAPIVATQIHWRYDHDRGIDFAVLEITSPSGRQPLPIHLTRNLSGAVKMYGFGRTLVDLSPGIGVALGRCC